MSQTQRLVARNVRRFRQERGMSMGELARRAGLAKQTLSTLEQAQGNPTVETLGLIADALDVTLRRLLTEWGTPVYVQRRDEAEWTDESRWTERVLDEVYGSGYVRTMVVRLDRGVHTRQEIEGHTAGTLHHTYVISGRIRTGPLTEPVELGPGDFARYPGDVPHLLMPLTERVTAFVVSTEPQLRQVASVR
jgi:transcriptional regulator with XRE-family HTH domain